MDNIKIKLMAIILLIVAAIISFSIYFYQPAGNNTIRIAYDPIKGGTNLPIFIAQEKGYFSEEGLNIKFQPIKENDTISKFIEVNNIKKNLMEAIVLQDIDIGIFSSLYAFSVETSNPNTVKILKMAKEDNDSWSLTFIGKPDIKSIKDLRGKRIAEPSSMERAVSLENMLKSANLTKDDVTIVKEIPIDDVENEINSGRIDAGLVTRPLAIISEKHGSAKIIVEKFSLEYFMNPIPTNVLIVHANYVKNNTVNIQKFRNAIEKAIEFENNNPDESMAILKKHKKFTEEMENLDKNIWLSGGIIDPDVSLLEKYQDKLYEIGAINNKINVSQMIIYQ